MGHLFISCSEAARRISRALDTPLGAGQRVGLWLHLGVCRFCRRFLRQARFLRSVFQGYQERLDDTSEERLSREAHQRLVDKLRDPGPGSQ